MALHHGATIDAHPGHIAEVLLSGDLEDLERSRIVVAVVELLSVVGFDGRHVGRRRAGVDEEIHQTGDTHTTLGSAADDGEHLTVDDTQVDTAFHVFLAQGHLFEELLHQSLFAFGGVLDEVVVQLFGLGHLGGRDVLHFRSAIAVLKDQHLHHDQVDDSIEVFTGVDGILDRRDLVAKVFFQFADRVVEVGVAVVELVHEEHHGLVGVGSVTPGVFGGGFNTRLGVYGADSDVGSSEARNDVT